ncbi:MAG TPA: TIGR03986 family CRISPR-associated RAMP protein, partial [Chloroflexi bacterium]|nr:TIGR03986 family CRISPR-associated RAMP protein [Chloroflexota bacterium]
EDQKKGCVSIEDAHFVRAGEAGIWHPDNPRIPQILGEPKPSAYQHYLVQDKSQGHDPDDGSSMAHYGTPPDETQIRGNKRYWHKGNNPPAFKQADDEEVIQHRSQYTRANTINPEVTFVFDIRFSHLRPEELGALCWALRLSGEPSTKYYHRIGMGKPLGMGLIEIEPALFLIDRNDRYCQLFVEKKGTISWKEAESPTKMKEYLDAFERFILDRIDPDATQLIQQKRIQELLAFHRDIPNVTTGWLNTVDYMALEDFKVKPVLPDPLKVLEEGHQQTQLPAVRSRPTDITRPKRLQIGDTLDHCRVDYVDRPGECSEVYLTLPRYQDYLFLIPKSTTPTPYEEGQTVTVKILAITEDPYEGETIITCKPIR